MLHGVSVVQTKIRKCRTNQIRETAIEHVDTVENKGKEISVIVNTITRYPYSQTVWENEESVMRMQTQWKK